MSQQSNTELLKANLEYLTASEKSFVLEEVSAWQSRIYERRLSVERATNNLIELLHFFRKDHQLGGIFTSEQLAEFKTVFVPSPEGVFQSEISIFDSHSLSDRPIKTWKFDTPTFKDLQSGFLKRFPDLLESVYPYPEIHKMEDLVYKTNTVGKFMKAINTSNDFDFKLNPETYDAL